MDEGDRIAMSVLTRAALLERLKNPKDDFAIMPLLDEETQVDHAAINLRLGTKFILTRKTRYPLLRPKNIDEHEIRKFQKKESLCFGQALVIHPQQLLLASSFEFISMPSDLCGFVLTRSRYARAGLMIATAAYVHPNWRGCLTLELVNYGEVPVELICGSQIGQLALLEAKPAEPSEERRSIPVGPEFPTMCDDPEWSKLESLGFQDKRGNELREKFKR